MLGNRKAWRLSIVSFVVRSGERHLHHNFVVALLNDLFGIQARGGCSCAGPYGHRLLGIDVVRSRAYEREILRGSEGIKPGWVRMNFNYFISEASFEFLLDAVDFVATHGERFLPLYHFSPVTGLWRHRGWTGADLMRLDAVKYDAGGPHAMFKHGHATEEELPAYLERAKALLETIDAEAAALPAADAEPTTTDFEALRWFPLPDEAACRVG
ncbi:MAG: hypothetical protein R3A78_11780 [Polyangiales bacterium]